MVWTIEKIQTRIFWPADKKIGYVQLIPYQYRTYKLDQCEAYVYIVANSKANDLEE